MKRVPCPVDAGSRCKFIAVTSLPGDRCGVAADLVRRTFPHMNIPVNFWERKICLDRSIGALENGENLVGVVNMSLRDASIASMDLVAVDPSYQGNGVGSAMIDVAEAIARDAGKRSIHLMTEQVKPRNIIFYSKHGYKVTGFDPRGYDHSPAVKFEKSIDRLE